MKFRFVLIFTIFLSFAVVLQLRHFWLREETVLQQSTPDTIIIDAGHGGEDGGAVAVTGVIESQINLAIALQLEQLLLFYGTEPVLLRREDISLHDTDASTTKEKKTSDLQNRVAMVNDIENGFLLSIHQNFYTEAQYSGAQVFFTPETAEYASVLQNLLREQLNPDNHRDSKEVDPGIYLLNHVEVPAVLIECGFLSNHSEASALATEEYQLKIACVLTASLFQRDRTFI